MLNFTPPRQPKKADTKLHHRRENPVVTGSQPFWPVKNLFNSLHFSSICEILKTATAHGWWGFAVFSNFTG
ncbi:hypothetical protein ACL7TT_09900 [Microbulbifer sp. 2304DJ12-6]|uniref:hypothetical protein n=1 Tax=Microbulbifer sp. 2304DJ12-6 TaxID=3233340 RepID=UPI0039AE9B94